MKKTILFLIKIYQAFISTTLKNILGQKSFCRFSPTCSEYARVVIAQKGVAKGTQLAIARLIKCQPFYKIA